MFKDCAKCGQHKQIPPTETLCYSCREKEESMVVCLQCYTHKTIIDNWGICNLCSYYNSNPTSRKELAGKEIEGTVPRLRKELNSCLGELSQKKQTIEELKQKLTTYLTQRKSSLTHEIQLIKEALHD